MSSLCEGGQADLFALVAYLPEPLAGFVDRVRAELAPGCRLRAHITLLPPRALACNREVASKGIQSVLADFRSFRVDVEGIQVFQVSEVIYLSVGGGRKELKELNSRFNQGVCCAPETYGFEPHITLAQGLNPSTRAAARELAERRWREYAGPRSFTLDKLTFVQGDIEHGWADLVTWELPSPVLV